MEQAPLSPASGMEVDDRDEYDRMLEDEDQFPDGFWEGVDELEHQYCATELIIFAFSDPFYS
jgi:hypothetical protein